MGAKTDDHVRDGCFHPTGTFVEFPKEDIEKSIPDRFEKIAGVYPKRIAVKTRNRQLTYFELNEASNRLANILLTRSQKGQAPIGLLFPKEVSLVVSILGTLKAGKICVLLDPTLPQSRLSHVLENAQVDLILTADDCLPMAAAIGSLGRYFNIDELAHTADAKSPDISVSPDDIAYIFYTSGSTGPPKGISENHRNLLFHIASETNEYHLCADDRLIFIAASGRDILRALLNGACVYPVDIKKEGLAGLADWMVREEITIFSGVATVFRHFVATLAGSEIFPHLRLIKLVGEMVYSHDVVLYRQHFSDACLLVNSYGPNEAGHVAHFFINKETTLTSGSVPVGYAVDGKDVVLFGDDGREVDAGAIGEIVVKSRYLSPGYWRRLDLTRTKFRPIDSNPSERLYFTGDLGYKDPDGCLTVVGRQDFQVKIRGNRVEISEVEAGLLGIEGVKEAVVVAREDVPGQKQLVAYFVPVTHPAPTVTTLRKRLAGTFPEYMIPSVFVSLDALPVIGIGKVNRQALPEPAHTRPNLDTPCAMPRTPVEESLAKIWREVLSLDQVGIHDNFLDLGGHSLAATRLISKAMRHFQIELPIQKLFECPTVSQMAAVIIESRGKELGAKELEKMIAELESLPNEEAQWLVSEESQKDSKT